MRNYSIYTLKTKLEFTNLYQYLSEKDYKQLEQQILCHSYHTPICTYKDGKYRLEGRHRNDMNIKYTLYI